MGFSFVKGCSGGCPPEQSPHAFRLVDTPTFLWAGLWGPQSDARYPCGHTVSPIFAGLSECRFSVPAPESHRSVVSLSSSQTLYRSFPCKHENSLTPLFLLSPKSLTTFQGARRSWQNHIPSSRLFSCNRLSGNKKSRHTNAYRLPAKG